VVAGLAATQTPAGAWAKSHDCDSLAPVHTELWEGDVAWAVFALGRYLEAGGGQLQAAAVRDAAAAWLAGRLDADGCLGDHTEGTLDLWWALSSAGPAWQCPAARVERCLLELLWDPAMGRFKGGRAWWQPYLDNQTWGAAFLGAVSRPVDARRALSFARETLRTTARGGRLAGLDGQGGPWSPWNEGTAQYAASGGEGAVELAEELVAQQRADGAVPGGPDDFEGGGVWLTRWHGVAPTAWLYFALTGGPFPATDRIFADGFECGDLAHWSAAVGGAGRVR
jgi:hypothetical protein